MTESAGMTEEVGAYCYTPLQGFAGHSVIARSFSKPAPAKVGEAMTKEITVL